ncbi:MAG TPA: hypothetical protein VFM65_04465 [Flavobacteriaceae bacterium]|nr:hypothetical protein [Flavobacteriaceae bacterium]
MKLLLFPFLCVIQFSFGQAISTQLVEKTPLEAEKYVGTDNYGSIYYVKDNIFYKIGEDKTYQFNDLQLGKLTSVDIINPLKITLFYKDMNTVVFLDRHLIEINRINFNLLPNFRTLAFASTAGNNSLWLFNMDSQQLEIFDYLKKKTLVHTQPLDQKAIDLKSNFNFCWLLTEKMVKKYNSYGSLLFEIPNPDFTKLAESNGRIIGKKELGFYFMKKNTHKFIALKIPKIDVKSFYLNDENLYIYDGEFIHTYQINPIN